MAAGLHILLLMLGLAAGQGAPGAAGAGAAAGPCAGKELLYLEIKGCEGALCGRKDIMSALVSLTDLSPGDVIDDATLGTAQNRLLESGYFEQLKLVTKARGGSCSVTARVKLNRFITDVSIEGTKYFFEKDLAKRLFIRPGLVFNPEARESQEKLARQIEVLVSFMVKKGFDKATVKPEIKVQGPDSVEVVFRVDEGMSARISRFDVHIDQERHSGQFNCPRLSARVLEGLADPGSGTPYSRSVGREVEKKLKAHLQQYGFISPKVKVKYESASRRLRANVKVQSCFSVVIEERLTGESSDGQERYRILEDETAFSILPFRDSGVVDRTEAELGIEEVRLYYQTRGFLFSEVDLYYVDYRDLDPAWKAPLLGGMRYRVTTGEPAEIRSLEFHGNNQIPAASLQDLMVTRRYDFFDDGGFLLVEQLFADLEKVKRFYLESGYRDVSFVGGRDPADNSIKLSVVRTKDTAVYTYSLGDKAFSVLKNDWETPVSVIISLSEGRRRELGLVELVGVHSLPREELPPALMEGQPFSLQALQKGLFALKRAYENRGYRKVTIDARCRDPRRHKDWVLCDGDFSPVWKADLKVTVEEGPRSLMGEIFIHGLERTSPGVLTSLFPKSGEGFDKSRLDGAMRIIRNLGVFSSVRVSYIGLEETPPRERIAVVIWVEEASNRFLDISLGFQTISRPEEDRLMNPMISDFLSQSIHQVGSIMTGRSGFQRINFPDLLLMAEIAYTDRNFFGLAKELRLPVAYGLSTTDLFRYASFMPSYIDRRFLATEVTMRLTPLIEYDRALRELDTFEYGIENELSQRLSGKNISLSLLTRFSRISWKEIEQPHFSPMEFQIKTTPQVRFDWRDSPTNPTRGTFVGLRCSYINALNDAGNSDNFVKYDVSSQLYVPFRKILVLAGFARFGGSRSVLGVDLPVNHRFRLGGTSGMRGFPAGGVLQYQANGDPRTEGLTKDVAGSKVAGFEVVNDGDYIVNGSVELRYPILRKNNVWGVFFLDWGAISESPTDFYANAFRFSMGPGIRWLLGGQIPIRLDWGFVLDPRWNRVDFTTGKPVAKDSAGGLDFGLLYTF